MPAEAPTASPKLWAAPMVLTLLLGAVTLVFPHGRDQGSYAYAGWRLLHGELPYRDVFVFKPPASVWMHSVAQGLFGLDPVAIRVFDLFWIAATALVVGRFLQALGARFQAGIWAACLVPVLYFQVDYWNIAQTDGWLVLPSTLALLGVLQGRSWRAWSGAGALAGLAILFKYTAALFGLPLLVVLWLRDRRLERLGAFVAGAAAMLGLNALFLVLTGSWAAFADIQFDLVPNYVSDRRKNRTLYETLKLFFVLPAHKLDVAPLLYLATVGVLPAMVVWRRRAAWVLLALVAVTMAMTIAQGKFYDYHYLPLLLPAALAGGVLLDGLRGLVERFAPHLVAVGSVWVVLLVPLPFLSWGQYASELASVVGTETRQDLWRRVGRYRYRDYKVGEIERAAAWIREHTDEGEPIFTWTYEPEVNLRAGRPQVSRFLYNYPFRVAWETANYDAELRQALAEPPRLIVVGSKDERRGVTGTSLDSHRLMQRHPVLGPLVRDHYCAEDKVGRYRMYLRCDRAKTSGGR